MATRDAWLPTSPPSRRALGPGSGYQDLWGTCCLSGALAPQVRLFSPWNIILHLGETCKALRVIFLGGVQRTGWEEPAQLHPRIREVIA